MSRVGPLAGSNFLAAAYKARDVAGESRHNVTVTTHKINCTEAEYPGAFKSILVELVDPFIEYAKIHAVLIDRTCITAGKFHKSLQNMSIRGKTGRLQQFGVRVLDANGRVRDDIVDHEYQQGTGCWSREIDEGLIMFIVDVSEGHWVRG